MPWGAAALASSLVNPTNPCLGRRVAERAPGGLRGPRSDADDASRPLLAHGRKRGGRGPVGRHEVEGQGVLEGPVVAGEGVGVAPDAAPDIVDEDVDSPEAGDGLADRAPCVVAVGGVGHHRQPTAIVEPSALEGVECRSDSVRDEITHSGPLGAVAHRDRLADTAPTAGDHRHLSLELSHPRSPSRHRRMIRTMLSRGGASRAARAAPL